MSTQTNHAPASGTLLPFAFIAATVLTIVVSFIVNSIWSWLMEPEKYVASFPQRLPFLVTACVTAALYKSTAVLLLAHSQRERYCTARVRLLPLWLSIYVAMVIVIGLLLGLIISRMYPPLLKWAMENSSISLVFALTEQFSLWLSLGLSCVLPAWLVLRMARSSFEPLTEDQDTTVSSWQVALGMALCCSLVLYSLVTLSISSDAARFVSGFYTYDVGPWFRLTLLSSGLTPSIVIAISVRMSLPKYVSRFATGRVLAASAALLLLWLVILVLGALLMAVIFSSSISSIRVLRWYLLGFSLVMLAFLCPLSWLCSQWFFRELAQPSGNPCEIALAAR